MIKNVQKVWNAKIIKQMIRKSPFTNSGTSRSNFQQPYKHFTSGM